MAGDKEARKGARQIRLVNKATLRLRGPLGEKFVRRKATKGGAYVHTYVGTCVRGRLTDF